MITSLLAFTIRLLLVGVMTFFFMVLFEHGPVDYLENVKVDFSKLSEFITSHAPVASEKSPDSGT